MSCKSTKVKKEYITECPELYIPTKPEQPAGKVIPLDKNNEQVRSLKDKNGDEINIVNVMLPWPYYRVIMLYINEVEIARKKYDDFKNNK